MTSEVFCQVLHNLQLVLRKHQTNPDRDVLQNNRAVLLQSVTVTKDEEKLRNRYRSEGIRTHDN